MSRSSDEASACSDPQLLLTITFLQTGVQILAVMSRELGSRPGAPPVTLRPLQDRLEGGERGSSSGHRSNPSGSSRGGEESPSSSASPIASTAVVTVVIR